MSKIVCDVCGTRYPDTAEQCPICGHIRESAGRTVEDVLMMEDFRTEPRQKTRGGRFSKSNVKKRTQGSTHFDELPEEDFKPAREPKAAREPKPVRESKPTREPRGLNNEKPPKATKAGKKAAGGRPPVDDDDIFAEDKQDKKANTVLNVLLILVILALLAVTGLIFTKHVLPALTAPEPTAAPTVATEPTEPPVTAAPTYPCDELLLEETDVVLVEYGEKWLINVDVRPSNTTDQLTFTSSEPLVASVDSEGCITALANGQSVITITCGSVSAEYHVICLFPGEGHIQPGWEPTEPPPTEPPEEWVVTGVKTVVNVRTGPASDYDRVRQCKNGDKVYVYEIKEVKGVPWGRLEDGWICLSYAKKTE